VARLRRRRTRLCVRSLRDPGDAAHCPSCAHSSGELQARQRSLQPLGGTAVLLAIGFGGNFWASRRLPGRPFGRRRVLVWSILLYAFSAYAASIALTLPQLLFFRCTTIIGVCVEYVAGVAWVAELFSTPKQRESVLGYKQAAFGLGGLMVTGAIMLPSPTPNDSQPSTAATRLGAIPCCPD
jgi:MFS family permease